MFSNFGEVQIRGSEFHSIHFFLIIKKKAHQSCFLILKSQIRFFFVAVCYSILFSLFNPPFWFFKCHMGFVLFSFFFFIVLALTSSCILIRLNDFLFSYFTAHPSIYFLQMLLSCWLSCAYVASVYGLCRTVLFSCIVSSINLCSLIHFPTFHFCWVPIPHLPLSSIHPAPKLTHTQTQMMGLRRNATWNWTIMLCTIEEKEKKEKD